MILALDTETTGVDFNHGARPFFVSTCTGDGAVWCCEWEVDPLTRAVTVDPADAAEIRRLVAAADTVVLHNAKFDVRALHAAGVFGDDWPWGKTVDTLSAAHVLASNRPKDLTSLAVTYLGLDVSGHEAGLEAEVKAARHLVQQARLRLKNVVRRAEKAELAAREAGLPEWSRSRAGLAVEVPDEADAALAAWRIADKALSDLPSAKDETWRFDYWLPAAMARAGLGEPGWGGALRAYASVDAEATAALWPRMLARLEALDLVPQFRTRMDVLRVVYRMETDGVTLSAARMDEVRGQFRGEAERLGAVCVNLAESQGYALKLPKGGSSNALNWYLFGRGYTDGTKPPPDVDPAACLNLPVVERTDGGFPSFNKDAVTIYRNTLPTRSRQRAFVEALARKRKRDTGLTYMDGYERFMLPLLDGLGVSIDEWYRLFPNLNPTGTGTLRFSSSNPNEQNISKQELEGEDGGAFNLRYVFGPAPGREWWSMDAKNIELRIPFYKCGQPELIELFERPDDPPYYGSNHLANFHAVYPDVWDDAVREVGWEKAGPHCKKKHKDTYYQWCKNGGFCKQYGGQRALTDATFRRAGAFDLMEAKFDRLTDYNRVQMRQAERCGYVETVPDRTVNPRRGYPLVCARTDHGKIKPTVPLSYHVQGTAMWWMIKAMIRCQAKLDEWRAAGFDGRIVMQVHDELVFDLPRRGDPVADAAREDEPGARFRTSNLWRVRVLQRLMEQGGDDIGVPTPVGVEYHADNWQYGVTL